MVLREHHTGIVWACVKSTWGDMSKTLYAHMCTGVSCDKNAVFRLLNGDVG